jgi:hypothetical protein
MDERFFRIMKHWLKAGDPDPYYNPNTDFVILPPKEFEIEEHQEETVSLAGSFLDMDDCTGASQQGEYVATISTGTICCFILLSDGLVVIEDPAIWMTMYNGFCHLRELFCSWCFHGFLCIDEKKQ